MLNRECEVLEPFCLAWYQKESIRNNKKLFALEPFYLIWDQRIVKTLLFETKDFGIRINNLHFFYRFLREVNSKASLDIIPVVHLLGQTKVVSSNA